MSALNATLAALFDCARKCDECEEHAATRVGDGHGQKHTVCDRDECGHVVKCSRCGETDSFRVDWAGWVCPWCGESSAVRAPRSHEWRDLPHADSLRAANAAHEARR